MSDDISIQILSQTSENIQKLFDLSTRIDERVITIQQKQEELDRRIDVIVKDHNKLMQKIAVIESKNISPLIDSIESKMEKADREVNSIDKRLINVEHDSLTNQDRWGKFSSFTIQLIWIVIASWLLFKLNLNSPSIP